MNDLSDTQLGPYFLRRIIGKGGMATVYQARQPSMDREVAIKVISPDLAIDPEFMARFEREAQTIAKLQHPHILPVYDFGREGDLTYLVMRLMEGGSLAEDLRGGPLPTGRVLELTRQIASALDYAHLRGIVHRDLKPTNVLLDDLGNAYLTDFGIAKLIAGGTTGLTAPGSVMGTPTYMAPEQWRAEPVDARTDVYALGVMIYQMLLGKVPFAAETPHGLMYQHLDAPPPSPHALNPDLPLSIEPVLVKALAKKRDDRYSSAGALAEAFEKAMRAPSRLPEQTVFDADDDPTYTLGQGMYDELYEDEMMARAGDSERQVFKTTEAPRVQPAPAVPPAPVYQPPPAYRPSAGPPPARYADQTGPFENWLWVVATGVVVLVVLGGIALLGLYWLSSDDNGGDKVQSTPSFPPVPTATSLTETVFPPTTVAPPPTQFVPPPAPTIAPPPTATTPPPPTAAPSLTPSPLIPTQAPTLTQGPVYTPTINPAFRPTVVATAASTLVEVGTPITINFTAQSVMGITRVVLLRVVPGWGADTIETLHAGNQSPFTGTFTYTPNTAETLELWVFAWSIDDRGNPVQSEPAIMYVDVVP
jgi:tRNA A-37 threonylcarbamoyl transferase component Bud32